MDSLSVSDMTKIVYYEDPERTQEGPKTKEGLKSHLY